MIKKELIFKMINEDIVTALRNAINRGESLEIAKQVMINSGYNIKEVEEASRFIGTGVMNNLQTKPDEELTMPSQKRGMFSKMFKSTPKNVISQQLPSPSEVDKISQQIKQEISPGNPPAPSNIGYNSQQEFRQFPQQSRPLLKELKQIKPKAKSYFKEIILLIILIILVGILISTIFFRGRILEFFSLILALI